MAEGSEKQVGGPKPEEDAEPAAEESEHETFDQELPDNSAAAPAERLADGNFLPSRRSAGEEHVREIEAGDEKDDERHPEEQWGDAAEEAVALRTRARGETRERRGHEGLVLLLDGIGLFQIRRERLERGERGGRAQARLEAPDEQQLRAGAVA